MYIAAVLPVQTKLWLAEGIDDIRRRHVILVDDAVDVREIYPVPARKWPVGRFVLPVYNRNIIIPTAANGKGLHIIGANSYFAEYHQN